MKEESQTVINNENRRASFADIERLIMGPMLCDEMPSAWKKGRRKKFLAEKQKIIERLDLCCISPIAFIDRCTWECIRENDAGRWYEFKAGSQFCSLLYSWELKRYHKDYLERFGHIPIVRNIVGRCVAWRLSRPANLELIIPRHHAWDRYSHLEHVFPIRVVLALPDSAKEFARLCDKLPIGALCDSHSFSLREGLLNHFNPRWFTLFYTPSPWDWKYPAIARLRKLTRRACMAVAWLGEEVIAILDETAWPTFDLETVKKAIKQSWP
ncbi:MAG TPA: hypothetical protein VN420_05645 [Candidatus Fimivivens sp.]|nr:hypothetical protein [Candidatus Fimivivens sp.]